MQITSQTWRDLFAAGATLQARATVGGVAYTDISAPVITRALMQDRLSVGNVVSASLALAVRGAANIPRSAAVVIEVRLNDGQTASEWLPQGTFYISRRMRDPVTGLLALECYDALLKANAVWTPSAGTWPRTMAAVTAELVALLGVTLDSRTVIPTGAAYAMSEPAEGMTIRDALSVIAQAAGGNWIMTPGNRLRLVRVGESGGTADVAGVVGGIDVGQAGTITGVRSTVDGLVTLIGDDTGIVVDVTVAPVIAADMAEDLIGQAYAPFRLTGAIYDPAAELGDGVRAGAGGEVVSALCGERAVYGPAFRGDIAAPDPGELTDEYPYIGSADKTLALAKAAVTEAVGALDDELTQQEIFNRLTDNGAAQGLLLYNEQLYINASYINAGYLNANHIQGGTLTLGGQGNQNGVLQVLDASGNVITVLNNAGADITNGSLTTYSTDRQTRTVLAEGLLIFQFYNSAAQPIGWRNALRLAADSQSATIGMAAVLDISARGRVMIKNREDTTDPDYAEIDMDGDSILLTATRNESGLLEWASLRVTKDGVIVWKQDTIGNAYMLFELAAGQSRKPLSIGNGGTGATTAADARANLGVTPANIGAKAVQSAVSDPTASGTAVAFIDSISQNAQGVISPTKKTVQSASQSAAGLMSAADKTKLDGIEAGAQVNSVTGVKGNAESSYRTGNVNITPANIGAVAKSGDTMTGALNTANNVWNKIGDDVQIGDINEAGTLGIQGLNGNTSIRFTTYNQTTNKTTGGKISWNGTDFVLSKALPVGSGGTGATTAAGARTNLGITPANIGAKPTQTAVADPTASGTAVSFIDSITQNANGVITPTKKTVRSATQSVSGLMSATDKAKLDGIAAGAQVNSLTGVKGNAESSYRQGNVNLTPANIGAAAADTHRYNFYTSPSQLGLSGDQTVLQIFNALPNDSVIVTASNLKAADMPNSTTMGELMIWRLGSAARAHILFYGKNPNAGTWRMYLGASSYNDDNDNAPDGVWYRVYDSAAVVPVSAGGTGAKNAAGARANLEITPANIGAAISLTSTDTTAALLYNKLKDLELNYPASIRVVNDPMQSLTGKSISGGYGTVVKTGVESGTLVLSFDICYVAGNYRHAFTTRVSQTTITPGAVYRYTGTAVG